MPPAPFAVYYFDKKVSTRLLLSAPMADKEARLVCQFESLIKLGFRRISKDELEQTRARSYAYLA